jgi:hypothetical protein
MRSKEITMSAPLAVPALNPSQVARDLILEVKLAGVYTPFSLKNIDPNGDDANMEAENRYSDGGYSRSNKTGTGWNVTATVPVATLVSDPTTYDAALLYLMQTIEGSLGSAAQVDIRWYEYNPSAASPRIYARQGLALATFKGNFGDPTANRDATLTFTGQGQLNKISHPYPQTPTVPTVQASTANIPAAGGPFRLVGSKFTGATAVNIAGAAATSFTVWSDGEITGTAPAHAAATGLPAIVTNAVGASAAANVVTYQ